MGQAKVTVLMPVYNAEKFLAEAINSILNQTLSDFEFLIIDDGSVDDSLSIIKSFNDDRIRLVRNEQNLGISATLNKGIALANTELIARMDADDISYPTRLQKQFDYFSSNAGCALISSWAQEITEDGKPLFTEEFNSEHFHYILNFECWIYHPTVMYKKSKVLECGGYSERYCEDYDLWWKLSRKNDIGNISEVLLDYRSTDESLCRVTRKDEYEAGHQQQVLRNACYYAGPHFELSKEEIDGLRYNFEPLLSADLSAIITLFNKLDHINQCIFDKDRQKDLPSIKEAAAIKRSTLLEGFISRLPYNKKIQLLYELKDWKGLAKYTSKFLYNIPAKLRNARAVFANPH